MAAPAETRPYWHSTLGDLRLWYPTFEVFAASAPPDNELFHGPHVGAPADLDRVVSTLRTLEKTYADALAVHPLPTLDQLRAELANRQPAANSANSASLTDSGSPCHNFWHWLHGDS